MGLVLTAKSVEAVEDVDSADVEAEAVAIGSSTSRNKSLEIKPD